MFTILHNYRNDFLILLLLLSGAISCYWLFYEPVEKRATIATIKPSEMEHCGDNCWQWKKKRESIDALSSIPSDYKGSYSKSSKLLLLEDGTPLRLPHSSKQDIQHKGKGRYRHYCNSLSFSTSDNTDPRSNGRTYEIGIPKRKLVLPYFGIFFTAVFVVCLSMLLRRYMPKISRPRCCNISTICFFDRLDNPQGSYPPPSRPSSKDLSESTLIMICSFVLFATFLLVLFNSTSIQARFPWMSVSKLSRTIFVVLIALGSIVVFVMHRYSKRQNRGNAPKQDDKDAAARQKIIFQNIYDAFVSTAARRVFFRIVLYTSALFLAFLPLINNWISAPSGRHRFVVWGALPNSDSKYYYLGALKLLIMGVLPYGRSALRPMNTSALAFDLGLFGLNIQYATAFRAFIVAIACILAARALAKTYNCLVGIIAYLTFLQFSEMLTPSLMSEPNAMIFGVLSFYFVWRGIEEKRDNLFYLGAFLLSMSLLIRTGAMFVIPCMIIAAGFIFQRKDGRTPAPWPMLRTSAAVILAISMNWLCGELYRPDDYVTNNENFNMVLYNIANGSGGWKVPANETAQLNEVLNITGQSAHRRFLKEEAYKKMVARP